MIVVLQVLPIVAILTGTSAVASAHQTHVKRGRTCTDAMLLMPALTILKLINGRMSPRVMYARDQERRRQAPALIFAVIPGGTHATVRVRNAGIV